VTVPGRVASACSPVPARKLHAMCTPRCGRLLLAHPVPAAWRQDVHAHRPCVSNTSRTHSFPRAQERCCSPIFSAALALGAMPTPWPCRRLCTTLCSSHAYPGSRAAGGDARLANRSRSVWIWSLTPFRVGCRGWRQTRRPGKQSRRRVRCCLEDRRRRQHRCC
jgi:hypothetical protein